MSSSSLALSPEDSAAFHDVLVNLSGFKESIKRAKDWMLTHRQHTIACLTALRRSDPTHRARGERECRGASFDRPTQRDTEIGKRTHSLPFLTLSPPLPLSSPPPLPLRFAQSIVSASPPPAPLDLDPAPSPPSRLLYLLYLLNDCLFAFHTDTDPPTALTREDLRTLAYPPLRTIVHLTHTSTPPDSPEHNKLTRMVALWAEKGVFNEAQTAQLRASLTPDAPPPSPPQSPPLTPASLPPPPSYFPPPPHPLQPPQAQAPYPNR